jgi:hypothetical protein
LMKQNALPLTLRPTSKKVSDEFTNYTDDEIALGRATNNSRTER